jgi:hypothetical protein
MSAALARLRRHFGDELLAVVAGTRRVAMIHALLAALLGPGTGLRLLEPVRGGPRSGGALVAPSAHPRRRPPVAAGNGERGRGADRVTFWCCHPGRLLLACCW